jgi:post-GPI attachment to proteins factor 3
MRLCSDACYELARSSIRRDIIDFLFARTKEEKVRSLCHLLCLKINNAGNIKRNGRWGFQPVLGMTEFFSSLFSFLNLVTNILCFHRILKSHLKVTRFGRLFYIQYYICNMAFISSTLFHIHETPVTRNLDYFFAFLVILFGFYMALHRILMIGFPRYENYFLRPMQTGFALFYLYHIYRMSTISFDYVYNKVSCIVIISLTFTSHLITFFKYREMPHTKNILFFTLFFFLAGAIEVQDIPPYAYLLDSHALWHLVSCASTPFYLLFWSGDVYTH